MSEKQTSRTRRAKKSRALIRRLRALRLSVHKTSQHIYAQLISPVDGKVLASASTLDKTLKLESGGNVEAAKKVGKAIAERAKEAGVSKVAFDRSGFKYHGRVKALADAAREAGLEF